MKRTLLALAALSAALLCQAPAFAGEPAAAPQVTQQVTEPLKMLGLLTLLSLLPAIVLTMTSFTRVIIVLGFVRTGIGSQQTPPNQVLVGIALFVTMFVMAPVAKEVHDNAYKPYAAQQINEDEAIARATRPIRSFMLRHTREADLALFYEAAQKELPKTEEEVPLTIAVPAFVVSELTTAFQMGVLVLLPFLLIDLACASVLMSMGMMMVPPASISLPLKLLLFVVVDGWHLLVGSLLKSFV
jgi:flagellar biosynthetic protein FliP